MNIKFELYRFYLLYFKKLYLYSNSDYISGNAFKKLCNRKFNKNDKYYFKKIKDGDLIFLDYEDLNVFLNKVTELRDKKFSILTHNLNGKIINEDLIASIPNNILFFSQNLNIKNNNLKNIHKIPTGLHNENEIYYRKGTYTNFKKFKTMNKAPAILCNINFTTNPERKLISKDILNLSTIHFKNFVTHKKYLELINEYMFVLCPEGTNIDTHRFWETLANRSIPVVKKSNIYDYYQTLGVPMLLINEWQDLKKYSDTDLAEIYQNTDVEHSINYLKLDFWSNYIKSRIEN